VQAPAPAKAIAKGRATFATLAHVVVSKFDHHLPLYRQAEMMAAQGVELDRSTLAGWTGQAAALLDPIVSRIRDEGLKAGKIHTDDTPVPVLAPGRGKTAQGRLWVYAVDDRGCGAATPPLVWYRFTPDRSGVHPQRELTGFSGHLQADAYAGYKKLFGTGRGSRRPTTLADARTHERWPKHVAPTPSSGPAISLLRESSVERDQGRSCWLSTSKFNQRYQAPNQTSVRSASSSASSTSTPR